MKSKRLTMKDIADMAGVGKSTVSRYFNGGYVKEETRARIQKIIDENGYEPNAMAQIMKRKHSRIIGIITPALDSITSSRMMMTMDEYLRGQKYTPIIINTNHNELRELMSIEQLRSLNVDGIILIATDLTMAHQKLISQMDIPFVIVGQKCKLGTTVVYDDYHAGYDLASYVAKRGHRDIAYVGVFQKDIAVGVERKQGVQDGLKAYGIDDYYFLETNFSFERTREVVGEFLEHHRPTAMICATDNLALACYKEIQTRGLRMPEDISLAGFGGYEISSLITPSLTTIRYENEEAACQAAKAMVDLIDEKEVKHEQMVEYILIEGGSVSSLEV